MKTTRLLAITFFLLWLANACVAQAQIPVPVYIVPPPPPPPPPLPPPFAIQMANLAPLPASGIFNTEALFREFAATHPCFSIVGPSCPDQSINYIVPPTCGGPQDVTNLQWEPRGAARLRLMHEWKLCIEGSLMNDTELEEALRYFTQLSQRTPGTYDQRALALIAEAERRGKPEIFQRAISPIIAAEK